MSDCKDGELRMLVVILAVLLILMIWFTGSDIRDLKQRLTTLESRK